jgi:hypothetical protein
MRVSCGAAILEGVIDERSQEMPIAFHLTVAAHTHLDDLVNGTGPPPSGPAPPA